MRLLSKFLDILYPSHFKCLVCGCEIVSDGVDICDECLSHMVVVDEYSCSRCGGTLVADDTICMQCKDLSPVFDKNYSVFVFEGYIKSLILALKYSGKKYIASTLSEMLYDKYLDIGVDFDIILPVPLHTNRLKERGFNQSELMLESFVKHDLPVRGDVLSRVVDTPHQTELSRQDRLANLVGAFKLTDKQAVKGKSMLLVDDVYTTGSTVNECAKVLLKAGAKSVTVLTLCRGLHKGVL